MRCYVVPDGGSSELQDGYAEIIPIHAALLPCSKVVFFSGDQHDPGQFAHGLFDSARVFDCAAETVAPCQPASGITDLFCCGHALLGSGELLIAGGTLRFDGFLGDASAWLFDPGSESFTRVASMSDGRWYPTLLTLGSGDVLAVSGLNANATSTDQNRNLEVFRPSGGGWTVQAVLPQALGTLYPRLHLLPDGRVLFVTPMGGHCVTWMEGQTTPAALCPPALNATAGFSAYTSVLLPLLPEDDYRARVLVANMAQPRLLDLSVSSPAWTDTGARNVPLAGTLTSTTPLRYNGMAVLLPTGEVLSHGGEENYGDEQHPVHALELYRPATNSWVTLPVQTTVTRAYHSVSVLLPDGRVWMAGSDKRCDWSFHNSADYPGGEPTDAQEIVNVAGHPVGVDNRELRIEIFEPWYVGRSDRPSFTLGSERVSPGGQLVLECAEADSVGRVALLRAGSSTHAFNPDQRYVGVPFVRHGPSIVATLPDNENLLPPGPYLVFITAQVSDPESGATLDVPSVGQWVSIHNPKRVKELKAEVDLLIKDEFEILNKEVAEGVVDPFSDLVDPAEAIARLALSVDNLERRLSGVPGVRSFIEPGERPQLALVSPAALAAVPITPIDPELLAEQMKMQGMHGSPMPRPAPGEGVGGEGMPGMEPGGGHAEG